MAKSDWIPTRKERLIQSKKDRDLYFKIDRRAKDTLARHHPTEYKRLLKHFKIDEWLNAERNMEE
jgi:hypothetical protein